MTIETNTDAPRRLQSRVAHALRRGLKIVAIVVAATLGVTLLALCLGRIYFSDERLRRLAEDHGRSALQTEVTVGSLDLSLFSGLEVRDVRVGPPHGFSRDPLTFHRLALHWSALSLLRLRVVVPEIAFEGVRVTLEENEQGQNLQAILAAVKGPATATPEAPAAPTEKKTATVTQPSVPVHVEIQRLSVTVDQVDVVKPTDSLSIDRMGMQGRLEAYGQSMSLSLWLGLGDREPNGKPSHLHLEGGKPFSRVDSDQRFGITLESSGLGDLELGMALAADTRLVGAEPMELKTVFDLSSTLDLLTQRFELKRCDLHMGQGTSLAAEVSADQILAAPTVHIARLSFRSDLTELAPLTKAVLPQLELRGRMSASAEPFVVEGGANALDALTATLHFDLADFDYRTPALAALGVNLETTTALSPGQAKTHVVTNVRQYLQGKQIIDAIAATMDIATPLAPWTGDPGDAVTDITDGKVRIKRYFLPTYDFDDFAMTFDAQMPVALLRKLPAAPPLTMHMKVSMRQTSTVGYIARGLKAAVLAKAWDYGFHRMTADVNGEVTGALAPDGKDLLDLGPSTLTGLITRDGDDYGFKGFDFGNGPAFRMRMDGLIRESLGPAPVFQGYVLTIGPMDLAKFLPLLPVAQQPKASIQGSLDMRVALEGRMPWKELLPKMKLPKLERPEDQGDTAKLAALYRDFMLDWQYRLERGLSFTSGFALGIKDLSYTDDKNEVRGLTMLFATDSTAHATGMHYSLDIADVVKPMPVKGVSMRLDFTLADGLMKAGWDLHAASLARPDLARPVEKAGMTLALSYKVGGDLLLDRFLIEAPDRGVKIDASGVISKPMQFAVTRGWEHPGLPGLDATLRCAMALDAGEQKPITIDGPELGGKVGLSGTLRAADGIVAIDGVLDTEHLTYLSGPTLVEDMSGVLPFDVRLAFDPRPDATVLKRGVALGSGVVALLTSAEDIHKRPARPVYYNRIRPYRQRQGLKARSIRSGDFELFDFELEGRLTQGMLLADAMSMHILGGDVTGNMALQLGRDAAVRADMAFKVSNIDASYFKALKLKAGPDSELSADMQLGLLLAPKSRDVTLDMNITKIGTETLDRFLQMTDPKGENEKTQQNRKNLRYGRINSVAVWMRYESLYMNLDFTSFLHIPGTNLGFPNIDRELLRRSSLTDRLDEIFNPLNAKYLAPFLGWNRAG